MPRSRDLGSAELAFVDVENSKLPAVRRSSRQKMYPKRGQLEVGLSEYCLTKKNKSSKELEYELIAECELGMSTAALVNTPSWVSATLEIPL